MNNSSPPRPSLEEVLKGRMMSGLIIEDDSLFLRLVDGTIRVDLNTREWRNVKRDGVWLTFRGWLFIRRVIQDNNQVSLDISGALYSARISARRVQGQWTLVVPKQFF